MSDTRINYLKLLSVGIVLAEQKFTTKIRTLPPERFDDLKNLHETLDKLVNNSRSKGLTMMDKLQLVYVDPFLSLHSVKSEDDRQAAVVSLQGMIGFALHALGTLESKSEDSHREEMIFASQIIDLISSTGDAQAQQEWLKSAPEGLDSSLLNQMRQLVIAKANSRKDKFDNLVTFLRTPTQEKGKPQVHLAPKPALSSVTVAALAAVKDPPARITAPPVPAAPQLEPAPAESEPSFSDATPPEAAAQDEQAATEAATASIAG